jgi:hypothetical protein
MRTFTIIFCIVLFSLEGNSQIIDSMNSWNYLSAIALVCMKSTECSGMSYTNVHYSIGRDSVVNNKNYKIVYRSLIMDKDTVGNSIAGFLRDEEDHKKIYFHYTADNDSSEILIYDFTLKKDSVFKIIHNNETLFNSIVSEVDSIEQLGVKRLRIKFSEQIEVSAPQGEIMDTLVWIEGIGSNYDLLDVGIHYGFINLLCFKNDNELQYSTNYGYDCNFSSGADYVNTEESQDFILFPNPLKDGLLSIQSSDPMKNIKIFNISGVKLGEYFPNNINYQLHLNGLESGVYIVVIDNSFRKIIVE